MVGPTFISLFAGCGGSSLGYQMAGFRELLAIDFNERVLMTFRLNFPDVPTWNRDIVEVKGSEIRSFLGSSELDHLDGSPPCQSFSTAGRAKGVRITDPRSLLPFQNIRLISELEPKTFLIENVKGLVIGHSKGIFIQIMKALKDLPYIVRAACLNAKWYEVPQSRNRIIIIGVRKDLGSFSKRWRNAVGERLLFVGNSGQLILSNGGTLIATRS